MVVPRDGVGAGGTRYARPMAASTGSAAHGSSGAVGPILRLTPSPEDPATPTPTSGSPAPILTVVADATWTPPPGESGTPGTTGESGTPSTPAQPPIVFRDIVDRVVAVKDVWADAAQQLDAWSEATRVADILTVEGTSYWYQRRQRHAMWLIVRSMHSAILAELVATVRPAGIVCATGLDPDLVDAARAIARRDGLTFRDEGAPPEPPKPARPRRPREPLMLRFHRRLDRLLGRRPPVDERTRRREEVAGQLGRLAHEPGRMLAVLAHARQSIETPDGVRSMNPYLGPIIERLRATPLDPIEVDLRLSVTDAGWTATGAAEDDRRLPSDVLAVVAPDVHISAEFEEANAIVARLAALDQPLVVDGIDLGRELVGRVVDDARRFPGRRDPAVPARPPAARPASAGGDPARR